jgi:hypothetical protein
MAAMASRMTRRSIQLRYRSHRNNRFHIASMAA